MCLGAGVMKSAGSGAPIASMIAGVPLSKKIGFKILDKTTPEPVKMMYDRLMPDEVRKGIIKEGGKDMLYNNSSEGIEANNKMSEEEQRQAVQRAFAAKYNNQVQML